MVEEADLLSHTELSYLLDVAKGSLLDHFGVPHAAVAAMPSEALDRVGAAFVTLRLGRHLRGCIGTVQRLRPVRQVVADMAIKAAIRDSRFDPVKPSEVLGLSLEVSVLTAPHPMADVAEIEVGRHGLIVSQGARTGLLLPQVASERGWDTRTFLEHTCLKAGLPENAWRSPDTVIQVFEVQALSEVAP